MSDNQLFYVGVKGLIQNQAGEYLLLLADVTTHRKNVAQYWDIPGGRMKPNEAINEALSREIAEETGITTFTNPTMLTTVLSNHVIPYDENKEAGLMLIIYRVSVPDNADIHISDEHERYEWVEPGLAKQRLAQKYPSSFTDTL